MAHSAETQARLRQLYVYERQNLKQACGALGIAYDTGRRWKRQAREHGDCWDRARTAARLSGGGLGALTEAVIEDFVLLFQSTITALKTSENGNPIQRAEALSRLSDAYAKTMKAAGATNPELAKLSIALDTIKMLGDFTRDHYPQHAQALLEILEPFGAHVSQHYG